MPFRAIASALSLPAVGSSPWNRCHSHSLPLPGHGNGVSSALPPPAFPNPATGNSERMQNLEKVLLEITVLVLVIAIWISVEIFLLCVRGLPLPGRFHNRYRKE